MNNSPGLSAQTLHTFERIEKKFWMRPDQYRQLWPELHERMTEDSHGKSRIYNIYYDTPDFALIRNSIERPLFKEKLRVRSYGVPGETGTVFVEIKKKLNGVGYKRRISVPFGDAKRLLRGEPINSGQPVIEAEILNFVRRYHPSPQVLLSYDRFALFGKNDPDFRITFDTDIGFRTKDPENPNENGIMPVMSHPELILMEIKAPGEIPLNLARRLTELEIYQAPFSKVGACYLAHLAPNIKYA